MGIYTAEGITERKPLERYTRAGLEAVRSFDVEAATSADAKALVRTRMGITFGTVYQSPQGETPDANCKCYAISPEAIVPGRVGGDGNGLYRVTCAFAAVDKTRNGRYEPEVGDPPVWHVETVNSEQVIDVDVSGYPIDNPAGQLLTPSPTILNSSEVLVARWKRAEIYATLNARFRTYRRKTNTEAWMGAAAECLLCTFLDAEPLGEDLHMCIGKWEYRPPQSSPVPETYIKTGTTWTNALLLPQEQGGWLEIRPLRGTAYRSSSSVAIPDVSVDVPVNLELNGTFRNSTPIYGVFRKYEVVNFTELFA